MRAYKPIQSIELADSHNLYEVTFEPLPSLEDVTYEDGTIDCESLLMTKRAAIEEAAHLAVQGYGSRCKVWQLSDHLKRQIRKTMHKYEVV